jgi:hypothetical protein
MLRPKIVKSNNDSTHSIEFSFGSNLFDWVPICFEPIRLDSHLVLTYSHQLPFNSTAVCCKLFCNFILTRLLQSKHAQSILASQLDLNILIKEVEPLSLTATVGNSMVSRLVLPPNQAFSMLRLGLSV